MNKSYKKKISIISIFFTILFPISVTTLQVDSVKGQETTTFEVVSIPCSAIGDPIFPQGSTKDICVMFPDDYSQSNEYPVIYYFTGHRQSLEDARYMFSYSMRNYLNDTLVVAIDGLDPGLSATLFTNSPVTGNYENYFIQNVIPYIDEHYPTINSSKARGIMGFSMGGLNCLNLALKYSHLFSAAYGLSPALLGEGNFLLDWALVEDEISYLLNFQQRLVQSLENNSDAIDFISNFYDNLGNPTPNADNFMYFLVTYGLAFAYNTSRTGIYYDFLLELNDTGDGYHLNSENLVRWNSGGGNFTEKITEGFNANPELQLGLYYGTEEPEIMDEVLYFSDLLTEQGIVHQLDVSNHGHNDGMLNKFVLYIIPFFEQHLSEAHIKNSVPAYPNMIFFSCCVVTIWLLLKSKRYR